MTASQTVLYLALSLVSGFVGLILYRTERVTRAMLDHEQGRVRRQIMDTHLFERLTSENNDLRARLVDLKASQIIGTVEVRSTGWPALDWFLGEMKGKLDFHRHKGGWENDSLTALDARVHEEAVELSAAILTLEQSPDDVTVLRQVIGEAADTANMAMMVADVARQRLQGLGVTSPIARVPDLRLRKLTIPTDQTPIDVVRVFCGFADKGGAFVIAAVPPGWSLRGGRWGVNLRAYEGATLIDENREEWEPVVLDGKPYAAPRRT